jgi:hypothetical protein
MTGTVLFFCPLIEVVELVVQEGGEGDPRQIGQHQSRCDTAKRREANRGDENGYPEQNDDEECDEQLMGVEEDRRPEKVECELDGEEDEGFAAMTGVGRGLGDAPDEPRGDGHEAVEDCPDWAEDPVGWVEAGFSESGVPSGDRWDREDGADASYGVADDEKEKKGDPGWGLLCWWFGGDRHGWLLR